MVSFNKICLVLFVIHPPVPSVFVCCLVWSCFRCVLVWPVWLGRGGAPESSRSRPGPAVRRPPSAAVGWLAGWLAGYTSGQPDAAHSASGRQGRPCSRDTPSRRRWRRQTPAAAARTTGLISPPKMKGFHSLSECHIITMRIQHLIRMMLYFGSLSYHARTLVLAEQPSESDSHRTLPTYFALNSAEHPNMSPRHFPSAYVRL